MNKITALRTMLVAAACAMLAGSTIRISAEVVEISSETEFNKHFYSGKSLVVGVFGSGDEMAKNNFIQLGQHYANVIFLPLDKNLFNHLLTVQFENYYHNQTPFYMIFKNGEFVPFRTFPGMTSNMVLQQQISNIIPNVKMAEAGTQPTIMPVEGEGAEVLGAGLEEKNLREMGMQKRSISAGAKQAIVITAKDGDEKTRETMLNKEFAADQPAVLMFFKAGQTNALDNFNEAAARNQGVKFIALDADAFDHYLRVMYKNRAEVLNAVKDGKFPLYLFFNAQHEMIPGFSAGTVQTSGAITMKLQAKGY